MPKVDVLCSSLKSMTNLLNDQEKKKEYEEAEA